MKAILLSFSCCASPWMVESVSMSILKPLSLSCLKKSQGGLNQLHLPHLLQCGRFLHCLRLLLHWTHLGRKLLSYGSRKLHLSANRPHSGRGLWDRKRGRVQTFVKHCPRNHQQCLVVKVFGDYLSHDIDDVPAEPGYIVLPFLDPGSALGWSLAFVLPGFPLRQRHRA